MKLRSWEGAADRFTDLEFIRCPLPNCLSADLELIDRAFLTALLKSSGTLFTQIGAIRLRSNEPKLDYRAG